MRKRSSVDSHGRHDTTPTDQCVAYNTDWLVSGQIDVGDGLPWCQALRYCESLTLAGYDDWRLPNIRELQSIVDHGRFSPALDPVFRTWVSVHWSSTSNPLTPRFA